MRTDDVHGCVRADIDTAEIEDSDSVAEDAAVTVEGQRVRVQRVRAGSKGKSAVRGVSGGIEDLRVGGGRNGGKRGESYADNQGTNRKVRHQGNLSCERKNAANDAPRNDNAGNFPANPYTARTVPRSPLSRHFNRK